LQSYETSLIPRKIFTAPFIETMRKLKDPRVRGRCSHSLTDVVVLTVLAVICGAESYDSVEEFGNAFRDQLKGRLSLANGIPSHDTINRVFQAIDFRQFEQLFSECASQLRPEGGRGRVIAIDGKAVRGSRDNAKDQSAAHLVHAWSTEAGLCLG